MWRDQAASNLTQIVGGLTEDGQLLYNVDGSMSITVNSELIQLFNLDCVAEKPQCHISLVDIGLVWQLANQTPEDHAEMVCTTAGVTT